MKKNILIVGYPKSGTTWLSRLVAQLVNCPLKGDWGFEDIQAPYQEGLNRESNFQLYKSHHLKDEIYKASKFSIDYIIYIIRDPRDVVISGMHYFNFLPRFLTRKGNRIKINKFYKKGYFKLTSKKEKKRQMIEAVLNGNNKINPWLSHSWFQHFNSYSKESICLIKYEDLLNNTENECTKILKFLNIETNQEHIKKSISDQSFLSRKKIDKNKKDPHQSKLLRSGEIGNWENEFSITDRNRFKAELGEQTNLYTF